MRSTVPETGLRAAVHSYVHVSTRPKVKPYFKLPTTRPSTGRQAQRAASDGGHGTCLTCAGRIIGRQALPVAA